MTKAKFILKGVNPNKFNEFSEDDPIILEKSYSIAKQLNVKELEGDGRNIISVFSSKPSELEAVSEIKSQLKNIGVKLLIFFASSSFNHNNLTYLLREAFEDSIVFGCSTAGEIIPIKSMKKPEKLLNLITCLQYRPMQKLSG